VTWLTLEQLARIMPRCPRAKLEAYGPHLCEAFNEFDITLPLRAAAALAQMAHESDELTAWVEQLDYTARAIVRTWPGRFAHETAAKPYAHNPEALANRVYANRNGNGCIQSGDGWRYRGRGPIQLSGRRNYRDAGAALGLDIEAQPELVERPEVGFRVFGWFWRENGLNPLADARDFATITRRINGGNTHLARREAYYRAALAAMGA
jgi:putative chitinase